MSKQLYVACPTCKGLGVIPNSNIACNDCTPLWVVPLSQDMLNQAITEVQPPVQHKETEVPCMPLEKVFDFTERGKGW